VSLERLLIEDPSESSAELAEDEDIDEDLLRRARIVSTSGAFSANVFVVEMKAGNEIILPVTSLPVRFLTVPDRTGVGTGVEMSGRLERLVKARASDIFSDV
jgi:hypothetical protein